MLVRSPPRRQGRTSSRGPEPGQRPELGLQSVGGDDRHADRKQQSTPHQRRTPDAPVAGARVGSPTVTSACEGRVGAALGPGGEPPHHLAGHHEVGRDHHQRVDRPHPRRSKTRSATEEEPCAAITEVIEHERPGEVDGSASLRPPGRKVLTRVKDQMSIGLDEIDHEAAVRRRWTVQDPVPDVKVLQLGDDDVRAWRVAGEQQLVDPPGRVPLPSTPAHLHEPGPHAFGRRVDRGRMRRDQVRTGDEVIAWQRSASFRCSAAVASTEPLECGSRARCAGEGQRCGRLHTRGRRSLRNASTHCPGEVTAPSPRRRPPQPADPFV